MITDEMKAEAYRQLKKYPVDCNSGRYKSESYMEKLVRYLIRNVNYKIVALFTYIGSLLIFVYARRNYFPEIIKVQGDISLWGELAGFGFLGLAICVITFLALFVGISVIAFLFLPND